MGSNCLSLRVCGRVLAVSSSLRPQCRAPAEVQGKLIDGQGRVPACRCAGLWRLSATRRILSKNVHNVRGGRMKFGVSVLLLGLVCGGITSGQEVRLSIFALDANGPQIKSLRNGVQVMQSRPATDPTSWAFQANMHGTPLSNPAWNQCQHRSFYFFSWHRMYLYYFERILRKASGDPTLTLPYWNYTDDPNVPDPNERQLPLPFRQPQNASNPLYYSNRAGPMNDGTGFLPKADVDTTAALAFTNFEGIAGVDNTSFGGGPIPQPEQFDSAQGAVEIQPHDLVHVDVGGCMADVLCSANDPIFFLHHANIDRLWNRWIALGGGRQDPTDSAWLNTVFTFFDESGKPVNLTGQQVLDTVKQLGYCYDDDPIPGCGLPQESTICKQLVQNIQSIIIHRGPLLTVAQWTGIKSQLEKCVREGYLTQAEVNAVISEYENFVKTLGESPR